jgi:amino acid transporter
MKQSGSRKNKVSFIGVVSIGVGGMVGGGIFAVLGLSVQLAHGAAPIAFAIAGLVAMLTTYSYAKLSVTFPSQGGTVTFIDQGFKSKFFTGGLNVLLWFSYVIMLCLYSFAFGSYGASFARLSSQPVVKHILISVAVLGIAGLNVLKADIISKAETWIVGLKLTILLVFVAIGFFAIDSVRLVPSTWSPPIGIIAGGMIIFLAYEGFELMANAAQDVVKPRKTLPRAFFIAVGFVIFLYIMVSMVTVGCLPVDKIVAARDYALAEAAQPFMGHAGFILITVAALLSTSSAINATMYGASRLSYIIAKDGELPETLEKRVWHKPIEGLMITTILTLLLANLLDLSSISIVGSAGFLIIFAAVNIANVRLHAQTKSLRWLSGLGAASCIFALLALIWQIVQTNPFKLIALVVMVGLSFVVEAIYRIYRRHEIYLPIAEVLDVISEEGTDD